LPLAKAKDLANYAEISSTEGLVLLQLQRVGYRKIGSFLICTLFASSP